MNDSGWNFMSEANNNIVEKTYAEMIGLNAAVDVSKNEDAFRVANECRDKEIDRFWTRGLYFWGFIVASFGAYMAVFNASLKNEETGKASISFSAIMEMSFLSKIALFVLSFICFVFCLSWLLAQKGSKFWQKNWERHISFLENDYIGSIFDSYLDTDNKHEFDKCFLSVKAYDYSVSKISILCSMLITVCSFSLVLFHLVILILESVSVKIPDSCKICGIIIAVIILFVFVLFIIHYAKSVNGNKDTKKRDDKYKPDFTYFKQNNETVLIIDAEEGKGS